MYSIVVEIIPEEDRRRINAQITSQTSVEIMRCEAEVKDRC